MDQEMKELIVKAASEKLCEELDEAVREKVDYYFGLKVDKMIQDAIKHQIDTKLTAKMEELFTSSFVPVNEFGKPVGERTTIEAQIAKAAKDYWEQWVDNSGKPTDSGYNRLTRAQWMLIQWTGKALDDDLKPHVVSITAELKNTIRKELKDKMDYLVNDLFRVRTDKDHERN